QKQRAFVRGVFTTRQTRHLPRAASFRGAAVIFGGGGGQRRPFKEGMEEETHTAWGPSGI
ncbi:unnamed protein product, partial [Staurois parvus]